MRTHVIVVEVPGFDHDAGFGAACQAARGMWFLNDLGYSHPPDYFGKRNVNVARNPQPSAPPSGFLAQ